MAPTQPPLMPQTYSSSPHYLLSPTPLPTPHSAFIKPSPLHTLCQKPQRSSSGTDFRAPGPLKTASATAWTDRSPDLHARGTALTGTLGSPRRCPLDRNSFGAAAPGARSYLWPLFTLSLPLTAPVAQLSHPASRSLPGLPAKPTRPRQPSPAR